MYSCIQKAADDRGKFFIIAALQKSRLLHRRQLFGGNLLPSGNPGGLTGKGGPEGGFLQDETQMNRALILWYPQSTEEGESR